MRTDCYDDKQVDGTRSKGSGRRWRWRFILLYGGMTAVIVNLLLILNLLHRIQESKDLESRIRMARQVAGFEMPQGYELTSALYTIHPRFFVMTHEETGQKLRVMEKRWWFRTRTPEEFLVKYARPGQWVRKPGLGYRAILVERTGNVDGVSGPIPYVVGMLESANGGERADVERGLIACVYDASLDKSVVVFGSGPESVFSSTQALELAGSLVLDERWAIEGGVGPKDL